MFGSNPAINIFPEFVYVLLKYIFSFLYISNVGASIILPAESFICKILLAVYTSAVKLSTVTSGLTYLPSVSSCSLFSCCGSCLFSLEAVSFSCVMGFSSFCPLSFV